MIVPVWLSEGFTVLLFGIGTVLVTLFILYQVITIFGRVINRSGGPAPVASRGAITAPAGDPSDRADGRRELLRAAAVAAAIEAYLHSEETGRGGQSGLDAPHRQVSGQGSTWTGAGRLAQMNERQQIAVRRGRSPR